MQTRRALAVSVRLLFMHWQRTMVTAISFAVALGSFSAFLSVTNAAATHIVRLAKLTGAEGLLTVTAAEYKEIGGKSIQLRAFEALTRRDSEGLRIAVDDRAMVAAFRARPATARRQKSRADINVIGTTPEYFEVKAFDLKHGRAWTADDARRNVAVVDEKLAKSLSDAGMIVGERIQIGSRSYEVVGIIAADVDEKNGLAIVPLRSFGGKSPAAPVDGILVRARRSSDLAVLAGITENSLRKTRGLSNQPSDFTIRDESATLRSRQKVGDVFTLLLPAIAAVSLIAGSIGIVAVMLLAVRERGAEIGLRRAIGATRGDILIQLVSEAILIALPGALVGEVLGTIAGSTIARQNGWRAEFLWQALVGAALGSVLLALLCALIPSRRASLIDPATALRSS